MKHDNLGKAAVWMTTGAAMLAAGVFLGTAAGRRRGRVPAPDVSPERDLPEDLADRPVASAALADAVVAARRVEQLSATVAGLEARLEVMERASTAERVEALWQKVLRLEGRLEQVQAAYQEIPTVETLAALAEDRLSPRLATLEARVDQQHAAIQQLQAQASQTEANLQKMIAAVEKLADQISRAFPASLPHLEPPKETPVAPPDESSAAPSGPERATAAPLESYARVERSGRPRWQSLGVAGCIVFSLLGLWTAIPRADVAQGRPATVVSARAGTPDRRIDAAIVSLAQLVEQHPYNTDWKYELGRLHAMKQNWSQAERWYRAVLQDNPNESRALNSLAEVLGREQQRP